MGIINGTTSFNHSHVHTHESEGIAEASGSPHAHDHVHENQSDTSFTNGAHTGHSHAFGPILGGPFYQNNDLTHDPDVATQSGSYANNSDSSNSPGISGSGTP